MSATTTAQPPLIVVVGPTASGKSDLAVAVAQAIGGHIVNGDASQLYRGMDIGTAKMTVPERRGVPHHLLDVLNVDEEASVAAYQRDARAVVSSLRQQGITPVLVGGSGLYIRSVFDPLSFPPTDPTVRRHWEAELARRGVAELFAELQQRDPNAAAVMEPANARRIVRALEVIDLTGRPFSASMPRRQYQLPTLQFGLRPDRGWLDQRISARSAAMLEAGLIAEVHQLVGEGLAESRTAAAALGYRQVLERYPGPYDHAALVDEIAQATRRFSRRQMSWFGPDPRIDWLDPQLGTDVLCELVVAAAQTSIPEATS